MNMELRDLILSLDLNNLSWSFCSILKDFSRCYLPRTCSVVQWLRLQASTAGARVHSFPGQGTESLHALRGAAHRARPRPPTPHVAAPSPAIKQAPPTPHPQFKCTVPPHLSLVAPPRVPYSPENNLPPLLLPLSTIPNLSRVQGVTLSILSAPTCL